MAVPVKQPIPINFAQGLDTKTDDKQVPIGKFLQLQNSIFTKGGLLQKRNGFGSLANITGGTFSYLTTFGGNLTAIGSTLTAYNEASSTWINKGAIQPVTLNTQPLVRNNLNQSQCDSAISPNNLICTAYTETTGTNVSYKYTIADFATGQSIVNPTVIPVSTGVISGSPRVFVLQNYFVIVFTNLISTVSHLQYIAVSTANTSIVTANQNITASYIPSTNLSWDGIVAGSSLFIAFNTTTGGQSIHVTALTTGNAAAGNAPSASVTFASRKATAMSMTSDLTNPAQPVIWAAFYDSASSTGYALAVDQNLNTILAPTQIISSGTISNITCVAESGVLSAYYEISNAYSYDSGVASNYIQSVSCTQAGTVGSVSTIIRSLGLGSKAFLIGTTAYFLGSYQSKYQSGYYLINATSSLASAPVIVASVAYQNGGGYLTTGLPSAQVYASTVRIAYLYKDLIASVNKQTNVAAGNQTAGIYSQTGVNVVSFNLTTAGLDTVEIGNNLNLSGGFLWGYDGSTPVENNFFVYPDNVEVTTATSGGLITAQQYFYQVTYEWTDNQGNAFRSAPSIPVAITTTGSTSTNTINVPYLRLTYKVASPVKIVVYRYSAAQEIYYQVTSITQPVLNSTTSDSVAIVDTLADPTILGNNIIYTNGGTVEDVSGPASNLITLFDDRLWLVDAEDQNLLWYSKQVIEATPVEMSDLFTIYVAPSTAAQGSTGVMSAIAPMDDKLIIFKANAAYYINGTGPDNTGLNSTYSQPIFITATVGCANQKSIVFTPAGLLFQSDKGIWLLGRDLSTSYIGAAVESFTQGANVLSALNIPGTNQVRFTMDSGITLMYDYYYGQWGTFGNIPGVSSTLYQGLHTYISSFGSIYQETPGLYLDGASPVLMSFRTGWINPAGLQGYLRSYFFFLLGTYLTPHKLAVEVAYDYNPAPQQMDLISPNNFNGSYGSSSPYGQQSPYGGPGSLEQWRIFLGKQRCQAFQIILNEIYDGSYGIAPGAGFTLSGLNLIVGMKKGWPNVSSANTSGGNARG